MASMRDIKRRRDSIQSTGQITKAMKLVSTVKLQKAKGKAESTKPYSDLMYETVSNILAKSGNINHKFLKAGDSNKKAVIVITANRGLAGGYNNNIAKLITNSDIPKEDAYIYAIGRKGREVLERKGYEIKADYSEAIEIKANIYPASGKLQAEIYGERLNYIFNMLYDGQEKLNEGDGICVFVDKDSKPDYKIISIKPYSHQLIELEKI